MPDNTDHVLDLIDGALRGDTSPDAMRWTPEDQRDEPEAAGGNPAAEPLLVPDPWRIADVGIVAWRRYCPRCRTYTTPADGYRMPPQRWDLAAFENPPQFVEPIEPCNICNRCRAHIWDGPRLEARYRHDREGVMPVYVLRLNSNTHKATFTIAELTLCEEAVIYAWEQLERALVEMALPECVVPGCAEKGRYVFTAAEYGRLAGRDWEPGQEIRICPRHGHDIYRAQGAYGLDQLAEWLQPDARYDALDAYDIGTDLLHGDQIRRSRARMLNLHRSNP